MTLEEGQSSTVLLAFLSCRLRASCRCWVQDTRMSLWTFMRTATPQIPTMKEEDSSLRQVNSDPLYIALCYSRKHVSQRKQMMPHWKGSCRGLHQLARICSMAGPDASLLTCEVVYILLEDVGVRLYCSRPFIELVVMLFPQVLA